MKNLPTLTYFTGKSCPPISFAPEEQDYMTNVAISQHLIGTLLFYSKTGQFEPFLAKEWRSSTDGTSYIFILRDDIIAEDGTALTAKNFKDSLEILLKNESKSGSPTDFDQLLGWEEFFSNKNQSISGLVINSTYELGFKFKSKPLGLLKYLSLPKFGFVVKRDFKDGKWLDKKMVTSTGPYKVISYVDDEIILERRDNFPGIVEGSAKKIVIKRKDNENHEMPYAISLFIKPTDLTKIPYGNKIYGPKYILSGFALSPKIGPFQSLAQRKSFQALVQKYSEKFKQDNPVGLTPTGTFYKSNSTEIAKPELLSLSKKTSVDSKYKMKITIPSNFSIEERKTYEDVIKYVLGELGYQYQFVTEDRTEENWMLKIRSYEHFDIRIFSVATGATFIPWVVKMMFCGKLGVGFPDIYNSVCNLIKKVEHNHFEPTQTEKDFEKIIADESQVIPFYYYGASWLVSKDIELENYSVINYYPRFDQLKLK